MTNINAEKIKFEDTTSHDTSTCTSGISTSALGSVCNLNAEKIQFEDATSHDSSMCTNSSTRGSVCFPNDKIYNITEEWKKPVWYKNPLIVKCWNVLMLDVSLSLMIHVFHHSVRIQLISIFGYAAAQAASLISIFGSIKAITPVFGGWLADSVLGRFKSLIIGAGVICVAILGVAIASLPEINSLALLFVAMFFIFPVGTGFLAPNLVNFGADQFDLKTNNEPKKKYLTINQKRYFSTVIIVFSVASILSYTYFLNMTTQGSGAIPVEYGYAAAYFMCGGAMLLGYLCFLCGTSKYIKPKPQGNSLGGIIYYMYASARFSKKGALLLCAWGSIVLFLILTICAAFITNKAVAQILVYISVTVGIIAVIIICLGHRNNSHLDKIEDINTDMILTKEVKGALDCIPILFVGAIFSSIGGAASNHAYQSQACQSNILLNGEQVNGSFFKLANAVAIIITVPILEGFVWPKVSKWKGSTVSLKQKVVISFILMILALLFAALGEFLRKQARVMTEEDYSNCAPKNHKTGKGVYMSDFSGFYMFLPFALDAVGDSISHPALMHFCYTQSPPKTRSVIKSFYMLASRAIANSFSSSITRGLHHFYKNDLNDGNLNVLYFTFAAIILVGIPIFLFISRSFVEKDWATLEMKHNSNNTKLTLETTITSVSSPRGSVSNVIRRSSFRHSITSLRNSKYKNYSRNSSKLKDYTGIESLNTTYDIDDINNINIDKQTKIGETEKLKSKRL